MDKTERLDFLRDWHKKLDDDYQDLDNYREDALRYYNNDPEIVELIIEKENAITVKDLAIDGNDVMKQFNLKPGPIVGAILNSLLQAETVTGYRRRTVKAIPIDRLIEICRRYAGAALEIDSISLHFMRK